MDVPIGVVVGAAIIVFVLGGAWLSARGGHLADVELQGDKVIVTMRGLNQLWALRKQLEIPLRNITDATYVPYAKGLARGLRWPGTSIPGVILAGTYLARGMKSFYAMHKGENGLVIDVKDWKFDRVIVDTPDPDVLAAQIDEARPRAA